MKLKFLFFFIILAVLLVAAEAKPKKPKKRNRQHHPRPGHEKRNRQKFNDIIADYYFEVVDGGDGEDDEEDNKSEWLFDLQEPGGPCSLNPCHNNGVCKERGNKIKCDCPKPFKGKKCEIGPKYCKRGLCGRGECVVTSIPPYYQCKCKPPFQPPDCTTFSVCDPNPCKNGGTCVRNGNDFDCQCLPGYRGRFCHVDPEDCYVLNGESYRGNVTEAEDGDECLQWNSHFILENGVDPFKSFENKEGLGPHTFCRNPDGDLMPWCFFRRGRKLFWNYCDVLQCSDESCQSQEDEVKQLEKCGTNDTPCSPISPKPTAKPTPAPQPVTIKPRPPLRSTKPPPVIPTAPLRQFSTCGKAQPRRPITRIFGGLKVNPGGIPWQVSLQVRPKNSRQAFGHVCGGVLIDSCWVLTAGHCIEPNKDMQVVMGGLSLNSEEPTAQTIRVEEAIVHENYRETPSAVYNDISLLRLRSNDGVCATESQFVKAACLPDAQLPDGMECTISGWGATEGSGFGSSHLLKANVLLINQGKCSENAVYGNILDVSMVCAGHLQGGVDSCQGDSGGPLTCTPNGTSFVYGLVSWGDECGRKLKPGVYTRVPNFADWIRSKIQAPLSP